MELVKKVTVWLMLVTGFSCVILGLAIGGVETFHILRAIHPFEYPPYVGAALFIIGGASLVQTGSVKDAIGDLLEVTPLVRSTRLNGRRYSDPQIKKITTKEIEAFKKAEK